INGTAFCMYCAGVTTVDEQERMREAVLAAVDAEEELTGAMPTHMRAAFLKSPEDSMRATVRATKAGIRQRIAALSTPRQPQEHDPTRDQEELCQCGHPYYRHFDTYEDMRPVG